MIRITNKDGLRGFLRGFFFEQRPWLLCVMAALLAYKLALHFWIGKDSTWKIIILCIVLLTNLIGHVYLKKPK